MVIWAWHFLVLLVLLGISFLLYNRTLDLGFLSVDDPDYVQNNPLIENLGSTNLRTIFTKSYQANYAPANLLSYSLDVALDHGKNPRAIHLSNLLWYCFVVVGVYLLGLSLHRQILAAAAAALLFVLHPAHVEVVAWISSRKDLLATGFAVLSATSYLMWRQPGRHHLAWYGASLFCFVMASASKQSVLLLPLVLLVWDVLVEKRMHWRVLVEKVPFGLVTLFFGWMTWRAQPATNQTWHAFVLAATELTNLQLLLGIGDFVLYRPAPDAATAPTWLKAGAVILAAATWLIPFALWARRQPLWAFLSAWILVQMIPPMLLNFIVPITDRYLFLPSVGMCLLLAGVAVAAAATPTFVRMPWLPWVPIALVAGFWGMKASRYVAEWNDPRTVWYGAHLKTGNAQVLQFLGEVYHNAADRVGNWAKSGTGLDVTNELHLARAILQDEAKLDGVRSEWSSATQTKTNSLAYRDLLWNLAWQQYLDAVEHRGNLSMPNLFMNRGRLLVSRGKPEQAISEFQTALAFAQASHFATTRYGTSTHALRAIAVAYWNMRKYREAQQWMLKAQEVQRKSGSIFVPTIDHEIEQLKALLGSAS